jgi:hypothetical protein
MHYCTDPDDDYWDDPGDDDTPAIRFVKRPMRVWRGWSTA